MEEKKRREAERGATPEDDDPALTTKTMRVKTEDAEELEIKYSVKVPEEAPIGGARERRRRQLEAFDEAAKESAKEAALFDETSAKAETNANAAPEEAETPSPSRFYSSAPNGEPCGGPARGRRAREETPETRRREGERNAAARAPRRRYAHWRGEGEVVL